MSGLTDSDTGLAFGDSLQFQTPIGGAGLTIETGDVTPGVELVWDTDNFLVWGADNYLTWGQD